MATFVCLHGAGGYGSYWTLVGAELAKAGHEVVTVDLPCDQEVGLDVYVDVAIEAIGEGRQEVVLVAQSLAGFVAPLVATRVPVELIVLVAAMVPRPGESAGQWWEATGHAAALAAQGLPDDSAETLFVHDVPPAVLVAFPPPRAQAGSVFEQPWPLAAWPDVPTEFILCRDDRFFPADWLRPLVRDRLGLEPREIPGGHCAFLSQPAALAGAILDCWADHSPGG